MPRRSILSATERESLLALPNTKDELIRLYTFSDADLTLIRQRRGSENRLGFAVKLCYMRYPGVMLGVHDDPLAPLLQLVAGQLKVSPMHGKTMGSESRLDVNIWSNCRLFSVSSLLQH